MRKRGRITGKKGFTLGFEEVVGLVLALLVTIASIYMVDKLGGASKKRFNKELCKASVVLNAKVKAPVTGSELAKVECPTRFVKFYLNRVEEQIPETETKVSPVDIKCIKGTQKGVDLKDDESVKCYVNAVNKYVADLMFDCWDQFGMGRVAVFGESSTLRRCVACSVFSFDQEVIDEIGTAPFVENSFDDYLHNNKPMLHDITYFEFLMDDADSINLPYHEYDISKHNAIVFMNEYESWIRAKLDKGYELAQCAGQYILAKVIPGKDPCTSAEAVETLIEPPEFINQNVLMPWDEFSSQCDVLK